MTKDKTQISASDKRKALGLGEDYPYDTKMPRSDYEKEKKRLQIELLQMQNWIKKTGQKVIIIFEGRDAAGKGGAIQRFTEHLNPRGARIVALDKPSSAEQGQWYYQRYMQELPNAGEIVLFDRSWYNRAGVERVMEFCTEEDYKLFLKHTPMLEQMLVESGVWLFKFWFSVNQREQFRRFEERREDPLKQWKLSPMDIASVERWADYTKAKEAMYHYTHTEFAPWTTIMSDDKKRARLSAMKIVLDALPYKDPKDKKNLTPDSNIVADAMDRLPQFSKKHIPDID
ncbi:polyphosphate kinase 2 [Amphritea sp. 1_MG-2023]|uniref:polyphosphate kinase 2 n=1 Tax=Amphritea sp. 1_MG-2023 TaxID=3062670 RepID=UPI0026E3160E|nr:polyphosphate kinase 2 [Amphritea sp. 1_MG-2023]MDO6564038.1 polyphosphate kinase 2 [Amphritea sp. 1_MG-2023]